MTPPRKKLKNGDVLWKQDDLVRLIEKYGAKEVARVFAAGGTEEDLAKDHAKATAEEIARLRADIKRLKGL